MSVQHRESQSILTQPIAVIGLGLALLGTLVAVLLDPPQGLVEWVVVFLAIDLIVCLAFLRLTITVTGSHVQARMAVVVRRDIALADIALVEVADYHPIRQFGGWGWRFGRHGSRQYAMAGRTAVRLTLADGRHIYLGSGDPERLAGAIRSARG